MSNIKKLCGFCINEWHLTTMVLPYISKEINNNYKIITILEKGIEENIKLLIKKLNLKNEEKILGIDWKQSMARKYTSISNKLNIIAKTKENYIILVNGKKNYMDMVNKYIEKWLQKNRIQNEIKIINCYEITEFNYNITAILDSHDKMINTSGEKEIQEVFEDYGKTKAKKGDGAVNRILEDANSTRFWVHTYDDDPISRLQSRTRASNLTRSWSFTLDYDKVRSYQNSRGCVLCPRQWKDLTVEVVL